MFSIVLFIISCHFGLPPINQGVYVEKIVNNSPEFDFQHVLKAAFSNQILANQALGKTPLSIAVLTSQERVIAIDGSAQQWELTLRIRASVPEKQPVELAHRVRYVLHSDTDLAFPAARQTAYQKAAQKLAADAVQIILYSPDMK